MKLIVLCGGRGSRLGDLTNDKPKAMVKLGTKTIIEWVLKQYKEFEYIFASGYKGLDFSRFVDKKFPNSLCLIENKPLGTGGAIKSAAKCIRDDYFGVINGDTVSNFDLRLFRHDLTYTFRNKFACCGMGINADGIKAPAGAYVFHQKFLDYLPDVSNLEDGILACQNMNRAIFFFNHKQFYDLGTPSGIERYHDSTRAHSS